MLALTAKIRILIFAFNPLFSQNNIVLKRKKEGFASEQHKKEKNKDMNGYIHRLRTPDN